MRIKKEHMPLIEKIARFSLEENWTDDALIHLVTSASVMSYPSKEAGGGELLKVFESPTDLVNLCYFIDNHYSLEIVCKALIDCRIGNKCVYEGVCSEGQSLDPECANRYAPKCENCGTVFLFDKEDGYFYHP